MSHPISLSRQLALAAAGVPLFEVFITKEGESKYQQQAVYLQRDGNGAAEVTVGFNKNAVQIENMLSEGQKEIKLELDLLDGKDDEKQLDLEAMEEGLNKFLNFLKDRLPDMKLKVFQVHLTSFLCVISDVLK